MKDDGYWDVRMDDDGTVVWRSRWGAIRVVPPTLKVRTGGVGIGPDDCPF
jgi:hypothetical protein